MKKFLFLGVAALFFTGCMQTPEICFEPTKTTVETGEKVSFLNCSEYADTFEWNFGDGESSEQHAPGHIYADPGTYSVSLKGVHSKMFRSKESQVSEVITVTPSKKYIVTQKSNWMIHSVVSDVALDYDKDGQYATDLLNEEFSACEQDIRLEFTSNDKAIWYKPNGNCNSNIPNPYYYPKGTTIEADYEFNDSSGDDWFIAIRGLDTLRYRFTRISENELVVYRKYFQKGGVKAVVTETYRPL